MWQKVLILLMFIILCDCACYKSSSLRKKSDLNLQNRQTPPRPYTANQIKTFNDWKVKHEVKYSNKQEATEREDIFHENLAKINAHNANPQNTYKMGLNHLSHYTPDEITESRLYSRADYMKELSNFAKGFEFKPREIITGPYKVVCYWDSKSVLRSGSAQFTVDKIDPNICTHIIYAFYGVYPNGSWYSLNPTIDFADNNGHDSIAKFLQLKSQNPNVKLMISIALNSSVFRQIFSSTDTTNAFVSSLTSFFQTYSFDGLDIYWKYPQTQDKRTFNDVLIALNRILHNEGRLLSVAVAAVESIASVAYNVSALCSQVDFVNLMSFDYHGGWENKTGINSPLYADPSDRTASEKELNVYASVNYWVFQGCPKSRIIVGIPLYGRAFKLTDRTNVNVGGQASGYGRISSATGSDIIPYNEICVSLNCYGWTRQYQGPQRAPYMFSDDQWIGYDDKESIAIKLEYITANRLGGAMLNSIDMEDYDNVCCNGKNPLISMIFDALVTVIIGQQTSTTAKPETSPPIWNEEQIIHTPSTAPASVDWSSYLLPIHPDQGSCGSCWAVQTTSQIESMLKFNNPNYDTFLSPQYLVDCDIYNGGCCGGYELRAIDFVQVSKGMPTLIDYPYNGQNETCSTNVTLFNFPIKNYGYRYFAGNNENMKAWVATYGTSCVGFQATDNFFSYESGVYIDLAENKTFTCSDINHSLLLVGYGTDPIGGDYWLIRNSWGPNWGMQGFAKIARNNKNVYDIACDSIFAYQ